MADVIDYPKVRRMREEPIVRIIVEALNGVSEERRLVLLAGIFSVYAEKFGYSEEQALDLIADKLTRSYEPRTDN